MSKVRVSAFAVSLDGYVAGPHQSLENPLGVRGPELFEWFFSTRTWKQMRGQEGEPESLKTQFWAFYRSTHRAKVQVPSTIGGRG